MVLRFIEFFYTPSLLLLVLSFLLRRRNPRALLMLLSWVLLMICLAAVAALMWRNNNGYKAGMAGYIISVVSTTLLTGPWFVFSARRELSFGWAIVAIPILPLISFVLCMMITEMLGFTWAH